MPTMSLRLRLPPRLENGADRIDRHYLAPGIPMLNGFCESFNGRMCDVLLNDMTPTI